MPNLRGQPFLAYLSQRLKWAFLIKICPLLLLLSSLSSLALLLALLYTFHIYIFFSRTTGPISTKLGTKHPWVKMIQVCSNEEPINSHEVNNVFSSSLNQRYDIIICVYWFELFSQVSDVAHGPLVIFFLDQWRQGSICDLSM